MIDFRSRMYGPKSDDAQPEYLRWRFEGHDRSTDGPSSLWLHRTADKVDGEIAGLNTSLRVDGEEVRANWLAEWVVSPERRSRGVGTDLAREVTADAPVTMSIEVSDAAQRVLRGQGWSDLGTAPLYVRPLDVGAVARRRGLRLPRLLMWAAGIASRAVDAAAGWVIARFGVRLDEVDRFDERSDAVWASSTDRHPVIGRRDAETLNRRFVDCPNRNDYRKFYLSRKSAALGYAVVSGAEHGAVSAGWLVDFLCSAGWTVPLLFAVNCFLRRQGLEAVYSLQTPWLDAQSIRRRWLCQARQRLADARRRPRGLTAASQKSLRP